MSSDDPFLGRAVRLIWRLRDHIERLDNGVFYAVDDLAVVLRAFVGQGKGNRVLARLALKIGGTQPLIRCSREVSDPNSVFAVGSIPFSEARTDAPRDDAHNISVEDWIKSRVLTVSTRDSRKNYTWESFLSGFANKWGGAHLDNKLPADLLEVDRYSTGGLDLSSFLIRSAAVEVWRIANRIFSNSLEGVDPGTFRIPSPSGVEHDPRDITIMGALQWLNFDGGDVDFLFYYHPDAIETRFRIALNGLLYDFVISPGGSVVITPATSAAQTNRSFQAHYNYNTKEIQTYPPDALKSVRVIGKGLPLPL